MAPIAVIIFILMGCSKDSQVFTTPNEINVNCPMVGISQKQYLDVKADNLALKDHLDDALERLEKLKKDLEIVSKDRDASDLQVISLKESCRTVEEYE